MAMSLQTEFTKTPLTRALITELRSRSGAKSLLLLLVGSVLSLVTLLNKGEADTLSLGEGDQGLLGLTDDENVRKTGGEGVAAGVLNVSDLVRTGVVLDVLEDTNTTDVVTAGNENGGTVVELDDRVNLVGLEVKLDGVVLLDVGVGETDGAAVVGNNVWHLVLAEHLADDLAELELGLLLVNSVGLEATLDVVKHAEVLTSLGNGENILETEGVSVVTLDLTVDLDVSITSLADLHGLLVGESVLQSAAEEHGHGDALTELVGALGWAGSVNTAELIKAPVGGGEHALQVLLGSSCHLVLMILFY